MDICKPALKDAPALAARLSEAGFATVQQMKALGGVAMEHLVRKAALTHTQARLHLAPHTMSCAHATIRQVFIL